jgi:hypothetical protein
MGTGLYQGWLARNYHEETQAKEEQKQGAAKGVVSGLALVPPFTGHIDLLSLLW